ncbi:MAG TPA: RluA family pseudouridine synthase [Candidatus Pullichristensenella excrementigallinarum]|uniref:RNA pseudouridylate synthase n=1 Tax=Candidatus Pullichristensenella excrementigallinarum TaxID=2840907 RepID=A0A9D1LDC3_9FIRM|nr:RluA family pseudouridine synthase [Candidatus Pullichristensenella excrementigallinarum]
MLEHVVPRGVPSMPLKRYISRAYPLISRSVLQEAFRRRDVKVNAKRCAPDILVCGGDTVTLYLPEQDFSLQTLFCDGRLLAVVKPQGLPVDVDQQGVGEDTLLRRIQAEHPGAQLLHRLDAATGGVLLAALDEDTLQRGLEAFQKRQMDKTYRAVVLGKFSQSEGVLRDYLLKDARAAQVRVVRRPMPGAKEIVTRYRVLDKVGPGQLVELSPVTGRTHQLRAHCAFYGHPLLGDDKYGNREANKSVRGLLLWCRSIEALPGALGEYEGKRFLALEPNWRALWTSD